MKFTVKLILDKEKRSTVNTIFMLKIVMQVAYDDCEDWEEMLKMLKKSKVKEDLFDSDKIIQWNVRSFKSKH